MLKFSAGRNSLTDREIKGFTNGIIIVFSAKCIFIYPRTSKCFPKVVLFFTVLIIKMKQREVK